LLPPFLDDKLVQTEFIHSALHHKLLDAALGDEPEHIHLYCRSTACKLYGFLEREDDRVAQTHPIVRYVPVAICCSQVSELMYSTNLPLSTRCWHLSPINGRCPHHWHSPTPQPSLFSPHSPPQQSTNLNCSRTPDPASNEFTNVDHVSLSRCIIAPAVESFANVLVAIGKRDSATRYMSSASKRIRMGFSAMDGSQPAAPISAPPWALEQKSCLSIKSLFRSIIHNESHCHSRPHVTFHFLQHLLLCDHSRHHLRRLFPTHTVI